MKIKKGDKIRVVAGKDKGREGVIERIYAKQNKALITGINIYKKHIKKSEKVPQGGVVDLPRPIDISKIALMCAKCGKPSRIGYKINKGKKYRICKRCENKV